MVALPLLLLLAAEPAATATDSRAIGTDPVSATAQGRIECYQPDTAAKTCAAISTYERSATGVITNVAKVAYAKSPLAVLETRQTVVVKDGAICGRIDPYDLARGTVSIDGEPATSSVDQKLKAGVGKAMAPLIDQMVCTRYLPEGGRLRTKVTVNGNDTPALSQPVAIVDGIGYRLAFKGAAGADLKSAAAPAASAADPAGKQRQRRK